MDFPYLKTEEDLADFTSWISTLGIKKVQGTYQIWSMPTLILYRLVEAQAAVSMDIAVADQISLAHPFRGLGYH
jgi:hypothetical protein